MFGSDVLLILCLERIFRRRDRVPESRVCSSMTSLCIVVCVDLSRVCLRSFISFSLRMVFPPPAYRDGSFGHGAAVWRFVMNEDAVLDEETGCAGWMRSDSDQ